MHLIGKKEKKKKRIIESSPEREEKGRGHPKKYAMKDTQPTRSSSETMQL